MLIRLVRMTFVPEHVPSFLTLFDEVAPQIRGFSGCQHLELWQDIQYPNIMTTYSLWTAEEHLHAYRQSALFASTWAKTKTMFATPPKAYSHLGIRHIEQD